MKLKRYFNVLIIVLAITGAIYQQQNTIANQEIAFQFSEVDTQSTEAQKTIAKITKQLEDFGVENIQIKEDQGQLKISYFSDADVASIKNILSNDNAITLNYNTDKQQKNQDSDTENDSKVLYDLDVYEIQNGNDSQWDFDSKYVLELDSKADRFFNPNPYVSSLDTNSKHTERLFKVAYKINKSIGIAIDHFSYKIPEVRAGPSSYRNS